MDEELVEQIAKFWSEWTDDNAPLNMAIYRSAAKQFVDKFEVTKK